MRRSLHARGCLAAACLILSLTSQAQADPPPKLVLIIHGGPESYPSNHEFDAEIKAVLFARKTMQIEAHSEYLENEEFGEDAYSSLKEYIRAKFRDRRFDIVMTNTAPSLDFALAARDELFPGVPIVFVANTVPENVRLRKVPGTAGIIRDPSFVETVEMALKIHPGTKRLHVVAYAPALQGFEDRARATLAPIAKKVQVTWGREPTLPEMLAALRKLPPDTLVLANRYSPENEGRVVFPMESVPDISAASPVPVYATLDTYIGQGVVGGMMRNSSATAQALASLAIRVLEGEKPESIPITPATVKPIFDWRQLQRWKIAESRLPPGSEIRLRTLSVWELYGGYIAGTVVVVAAQLALIGLLLTQRVRLRRADNTIRAREASLRTSFARTRRLASRLLRAQEEVRAEIARDLHDDVCQKLAYVSVGVNTLRGTSGDIQSPHAQQVFEELERDTRKTFDEIRRMSHDLHPATLRLLGLAPALRAHCADVSKRQGLEVDFACNDIGTVHPEVAVAFFRIAQEAIRNSIAHGAATHITVTLTRADNQLELVVADDGRGFDVEAVRSAGGGLGLIAMDERVNAMSGELNISSTAGRGTSVRVRAAVEPVEPGTRN